MLSEEKINESNLIDCFMAINFYLRDEYKPISTKRKLNYLTKKTKKLLSTYTSEEDKLNQLISVFYDHMAFKGPSYSNLQYDTLFYLDHVLEEREGSALLLAVIFCHIASQHDLVANSLFYFGQVIIRVDFIDKASVFINAETGEFIPLRNLKLYVKNSDTEIVFNDEMLAPLNKVHCVLLLLNMLKRIYMEKNQLDKALVMSNLHLLIYPEDPYEKRERGLIFAKLGCPHIAIQELEFFVEACPDDPMTEITKAQISAIMPEPTALH